MGIHILFWTIHSSPSNQVYYHHLIIWSDIQQDWAVKTESNEVTGMLLLDLFNLLCRLLCQFVIKAHFLISIYT